MILVEDMDNLIIDLCYQELKMINKGYDEEEDILFNFHKVRREVIGTQLEIISLYTKWHIHEGLHQLNEEDNKVKSRTLALDNTPNFKDYNRNKRLQRRLTMNINKFIGEFQIPVYNKLTHYNFYDTLDALIKLVFTEDHMRMYHER